MRINLQTERFLLEQRTELDIIKMSVLSDSELSIMLNLNDYKEVIVERTRMNRLLLRNPSLYYLWDIKKNGSEKVIGNLGFHNYVIEHKRSEIGYMCYKGWRNQGVVTESLEAILRFGFSKLSLIRVEAYLDKDNFASESVLKKSNFKKEGLLRSHYVNESKKCDSLVYSLLAAEFIN